MLTFVNHDQERPDVRGVDDRKGDFGEIYREFIQAKAEEQASRCSQCGVPFCQSGCPLQNNIPDWLMLAAEGRLEEAYRVSSATNLMPEICGRICPQDRLCEGACVIEKSGHGSVTIGAVERWITETAFENNWVPPITVGSAGQSDFAIIGAGPAGLSAAERLRSFGHNVTIYDRYDRAGGLLTYGIPGFKLEKDVVMRRVNRLEAAGVAIKTEFEIGRDADLAELRDRHAGVFIAVGAYAARDLTCPVDADAGVVKALEFLTASNRRGFGDDLPAADKTRLDAQGRRVIVIGGGDTAMDCVRTAVRQGASSVTCLYRRDRENMPGSAREVKNAEEEGVVFEWLAAPKAIAQSEQALDVRVARMRLGAPDGSGRRAPEEVPGADFTLKADLVVEALGFSPEDTQTLFNDKGLTLNRRGTLPVDHCQMTAVDGVFAGGDVVRGASLVVWAVRDGMEAARHMHDWALRTGATAPAPAVAAE